MSHTVSSQNMDGNDQPLDKNKTPSTAESQPIKIQPPPRTQSGCGMVLALLVVSAMTALFLYRQTTPREETRLICIFNTPELKIETNVFLVRPFQGDIEDIRLRYRTAKKPAMDQSQQRAKDLLVTREQLNQIERDLLELDEEQAQQQKQFQTVIAKKNQELDTTWQNWGEELKREYDAKRAEFLQIIATRAKTLNMEWPETFEISEPDVVISAFRLGLYRLPETVDKNTELSWAQEELNKWRVFQNGWQQRREATKLQAETAREELKPLLEQSRKQTEKYQQKKEELEKALVNLKQDLHEKEILLDQSQPTNTLSSRDQFLIELNALPEKYKIISAQSNFLNRAIFSGLESQPEIPLSNLSLFVRAYKDGEIYWCLFPLEISALQETRINITPNRFQALKDILEGKDDF